MARTEQRAVKLARLLAMEPTGSATWTSDFLRFFAPSTLLKGIRMGWLMADELGIRLTEKGRYALEAQRGKGE